MFIASQIMGLIVIILIAIGMQFKDKTKLLRFQSIAAFFKVFAMAFVGGFSGAINQVVGLIRKLWFYNNSRINRVNKIASLIIFSGLAITVAIIFWEGYISLLPMLSIIGVTYAFWQDDPYILRWVSLVGCLGFGAYSFITGAYTNGISEIISIIATLISIYKLYKQDKRST